VKEHNLQNICQQWNIITRTSDRTGTLSPELVRPATLSTELLTNMEHYHQNFCQTWNIITRTSDKHGTISPELLSDMEHYHQNF
jgi:hypothetical protein